MASLAERYEAGDHRQVWDELVALGPEVYEPALLRDAEAVADLTMQRVAANIATLVVRLTLMGYRFGGRNNRNQRRRTIEELGLRDSLEAAGRDVSWVDAGPLEEHVMGWEAPAPMVESELEKLDQALGPLPVSLRALVRRVDTVNLAGSFPDWTPATYAFEDDALDAPAVEPVTDALNFNGVVMINETFQPQAVVSGGRFVPARSYALPVGANHVLGANQAGDFHSVRLPDRVADPVLDGVLGRPGIRLVEYLRVAFEWGGFPGFEFAPRVPRQVDVLRRDLLPI